MKWPHLALEKELLFQVLILPLGGSCLNSRSVCLNNLGKHFKVFKGCSVMKYVFAGHQQCGLSSVLGYWHTSGMSSQNPGPGVCALTVSLAYLLDTFGS